MKHGEEIVPLTALGTGDLSRVRDVFEEAFEPHEREPFEELLRRERHKEARTVVLRDAGGPLAFATTSLPGPEGWSYLEYFAVDAAARGGGIGAALWHEVVARLPAHAPRLVLEIHDPSGEPEGSPARRTHERRRSFYLRLGAVELPVPGYLMPELHDHDQEAHPGLLLARLPDGVLPDTGELSELVRALHITSYGLREHHPLTERVLRGLGPDPRRSG